MFQSVVFTVSPDCCHEGHFCLLEPRSLSFTFIPAYENKRGPVVVSTEMPLWGTLKNPSVFIPVPKIVWSLTRALPTGIPCWESNILYYFLIPSNSSSMFLSVYSPNSALLCFSNSSWNEPTALSTFAISQFPATLMGILGSQTDRMLQLYYR